MSFRLPQSECRKTCGFLSSADAALIGGLMGDVEKRLRFRDDAGVTTKFCRVQPRRSYGTNRSTDSPAPRLHCGRTDQTLIAGRRQDADTLFTLSNVPTLESGPREI